MNIVINIKFLQKILILKTRKILNMFLKIYIDYLFLFIVIKYVFYINYPKNFCVKTVFFRFHFFKSFMMVWFNQISPNLYSFGRNLHTLYYFL